MSESGDHSANGRFHLAARRELALLCLLFIVSLFLHLWFLRPATFDGLYGQDSYAYYDFAGELREAISKGRAPGPFFWPLGYPALLTTAFALFGTQATTGQAINIMLGSALTPLVYILARQMGLRHAGAIIAGLLMLRSTAEISVPCLSL